MVVILEPGSRVRKLQVPGMADLPGMVSPKSMIQSTRQPVAEEIAKFYNPRTRLAMCPFVVQVLGTHQNSTKEYSARGIARKGIAKQDMWWRR